MKIYIPIALNYIGRYYVTGQLQLIWIFFVVNVACKSGLTCESSSNSCFVSLECIFSSKLVLSVKSFDALICNGKTSLFNFTALVANILALNGVSSRATFLLGNYQLVYHLANKNKRLAYVCDLTPDLA